MLYLVILYCPNKATPFSRWFIFLKPSVVITTTHIYNHNGHCCVSDSKHLSVSVNHTDTASCFKLGAPFYVSKVINDLNICQLNTTTCMFDKIT